MNKPKIIFKLFLFLTVLSITNSFAQTNNKQLQSEPCYEVTLQLLISSNNATEKNSVPTSLSNVVKKLKTNYNFSDYRLATTFFQRTSDSIEYKSLLNDFIQNQDKNTPVFSEWTLNNLRNMSNAQGQNVIQFGSFRFGARIPVVTGNVKDESGKLNPIVNYESIGITTTRFSLSENEPTVIGSLATAKPDELMFLVLTVKPVE
jgi:hypothetical protein